MQGTVVASHGLRRVVETPDGQRRICHPGQKKPCCGGRPCDVASRPQGQGMKARLRRFERRNLFYRQDEIRTKSFAANIDQVLILIAAEPVFQRASWPVP